MEKNEVTLANEKCRIILNHSEKCISGKDYTDPRNEPKFFTTSKRNLVKSWKELELKFHTEMTMYEGIEILKKFNISIHRYCGID